MSCSRKYISKPPRLYWSTFGRRGRQKPGAASSWAVHKQAVSQGRGWAQTLVPQRESPVLWGHTCLCVPCTGGWRCWRPGRGCRSARPVWCPPDSHTAGPGDRRLPRSPFHLLFQQPAEGIVQLYFVIRNDNSGSRWKQAALPSECCLESSGHGLGKNNPEPVHSTLMQIPCLTGFPSTVPTTSTGSWNSNNINCSNENCQVLVYTPREPKLKTEHTFYNTRFTPNAGG